MIHKIIQYFSQCTDTLNSGNHIYYWKPKGLSGKRINSIKTRDYGITPKLNNYGTKTRV